MPDTTINPQAVKPKPIKETVILDGQDITVSASGKSAISSTSTPAPTSTTTPNSPNSTSPTTTPIISNSPALSVTQSTPSASFSATDSAKPDLSSTPSPATIFTDSSPDPTSADPSLLPSPPPPPLATHFAEYVGVYQQARQYEKKASISPIRVDELASKVASLYEKLRRIIDWKEEHVVRRTAIERILKRSLLPEISGVHVLDADKMAEPLVLELIRSGYFSNGRIPKNKIPQVREVLARYIYVISHNPLISNGQLSNNLKVKQKINFFTWVLEIAACEIEQVMDPAIKENALLNLMTNTLFSRIRLLPANQLSDQDKLIQIYIAVHRTLFDLDEPFISYNLLKIRYPDWFAGEPQFVEWFANHIDQVQQVLEADLNHPHAKYFYTIAERLDAAYLTIGDIFAKATTDKQDPVTVVQNEESLDLAIDEVYDAREKTLKGRLLRSAFYSTLSIFLSGIASYIIFEGPVARLVSDNFSPFALAVDIAVPTAIMFFLVIIIKPPSRKSNIPKLKEEVKKVIFKEYESDEIELNLNKKKSWLLSTIFGIISLMAGSITAYGIYTIFKWGRVPWTSLYIDTITVGMIIFAAMVIRDRAKEMSVEEGGRFTDFVIDLFTIPLAKVGQWFAQKWREYNIFSVFFTVLIDTPFSVIIGIIEEWRNFLKDARNELR